MGKSESETTSAPSTPDYTSAIESMAEAMISLQEQQTEVIQATTQAQLLKPPDPTPTKTYDWEAKRQQLKEGIALEAEKEAARKKGRSSTILTSKLDPNPDVVSQSLIAEET
ncbi:MAG: hypothetical protein PVG39_00865 [Desulfobacteraceae bacterium]|jgi:hypothetical protein